MAGERHRSLGSHNFLLHDQDMEVLLRPDSNTTVLMQVSMPLQQGMLDRRLQTEGPTMQAAAAAHHDGASLFSTPGCSVGVTARVTVIRRRARAALLAQAGAGAQETAAVERMVAACGCGGPQAIRWITATQDRLAAGGRRAQGLGPTCMHAQQRRRRARQVRAQWEGLVEANQCSCAPTHADFEMEPSQQQEQARCCQPLFYHCRLWWA